MTGFAIWLGGLMLLVLIWLLFRSGGYKREPLNEAPGADGTPGREQIRSLQKGRGIS